MTQIHSTLRKLYFCERRVLKPKRLICEQDPCGLQTWPCGGPCSWGLFLILQGGPRFLALLVMVREDCRQSNQHVDVHDEDLITCEKFTNESH